MSQEKLEQQKDYDEAINIGAFGTLGFLCTVILPMTLSKEAWFSSYMWPTFFVGVTLLLIYIAISFERNSFLSSIWKYGSVKLSISVALTIIIYFASFTASSDINRIFGIDASAFPYTLAAVTFLNIFITIEPIFRILFIISGLSLVLKYFEYKSTGKFGWLGFLFIFGCFASGGYGWFLNASFFSDQQDIDLKIYKIAHKVDFSSNYPCKISESATKVIFLGPQMNQVLFDEVLASAPNDDFNIFDTAPVLDPEESLKMFIMTTHTKSKLKVPANFKVGACVQT